MAIFGALEQTPQPTRAIDTGPSVVGAISGLLAGTGLFDQRAAPRQPTEGEKFQADWNSFVAETKGTLSPSDPNYRQNLRALAPSFLASNPQYAPEMKTFLETQGVTFAKDVETEKMDAQQEALANWSATPLGIVADATARAAATDTNGNFDQRAYDAAFKKAYTIDIGQRADAEVASREAAAMANKATAANHVYNAARPYGAQIVGFQVDALATLAQDISDDGRATVTPALAGVLGLPEGEINADNAKAALTRYRGLLAQVLSTEIISYGVSAGADQASLMGAPPSKAYIDELLFPVDKMIEAVQEKDWASVLNSSQLQDDLAAMSKMPPSVRGLASLLRVVPPEVRDKVYTEALAANPNLARDAVNSVLATFSADATVQQTVDDVNGKSGEDAKNATDVSLTALNAGGLPAANAKQAVVTFFAGLARLGEARPLGKEEFEAFAKNSEGLNSSASSDPEFGGFLKGKFASDLQVTLDAATSDIKTEGGATIVFSGGKYVVNGVSVVAVASMNVTNPNIYIGEDGTVHHKFVDLLNDKLGVMSNFGDIGNEVSGAFNALHPESEGGLAAGPKAPVPSSYFIVTPDMVPEGSSLVAIGRANVVTNTGMKPLVSGLAGASNLVKPGADTRMEGVLQGPFQALQTTFGKPVVINDGIAKAGTTREKETKGSRHFHGDALDISIAGMNDEEVQRLVDAAITAGFQGFGFGKGILHIDLGAKRAWAYGNQMFGGVPVVDMISKIQGSNVPVATISTDPRQPTPEAAKGDMSTPESDPSEGRVSSFTLFSGGASVAAPSQATVGPAGKPVTPTEILPEEITPARVGAGEDIPPQAQANPEIQALVKELSESPDKTFTTDAEFLAAQSRGEVQPGESVVVDGTVYLIRRDGSARLIGRVSE